MHELAVAESILNIANAEMEKRNLIAIESICVRVGVLSDVVPEALQFSFEALTKGTKMDGTDLQIETIPVRGRCHGCRQEFEVLDYVFECPLCDSRDIKLTQGDELDIAYMEVKDNEAESKGGREIRDDR